MQSIARIHHYCLFQLDQTGAMSVGYTGVRSIGFGTEFSDVCRDLIEICINTANAECFLYVNDGVEDDVWGCVELSNEEFFTIINQA